LYRRPSIDVDHSANFVDKASPHFPTQDFSFNDSFSVAGSNARAMLDEVSYVVKLFFFLPDALTQVTITNLDFIVYNKVDSFIPNHGQT
jgi:hypothetical protein